MTTVFNDCFYLLCLVSRVQFVLENYWKFSNGFLVSKQCFWLRDSKIKVSILMIKFWKVASFEYENFRSFMVYSLEKMIQLFFVLSAGLNLILFKFRHILPLKRCHVRQGGFEAGHQNGRAKDFFEKNQVFKGLCGS